MQIHCFYSEICNAVMDYRRFHAKYHAQAAARTHWNSDKNEETEVSDHFRFFDVCQAWRKSCGCNYGLEGGAFLILGGVQFSSLPKEEERLREPMR